VSWIDEALRRDPDIAPARLWRRYMKADPELFYRDQAMCELLEETPECESRQRSWLTAVSYMNARDWSRAARPCGGAMLS